jgi:hypothetical protein
MQSNETKSVAPLCRRKSMRAFGSMTPRERAKFIMWETITAIIAVATATVVAELVFRGAHGG